MPLYEYECEECSKQVEILVPNFDSKAMCPECGSKKLTKLLSVIGSPITSNGISSTRGGEDAGSCGRNQCASGGCMFGN